MCRSYVSVNWNGEIYDCDFNQQVELHPIHRKGQFESKDGGGAEAGGEKGGSTCGRGGRGAKRPGTISVFDIASTDELLDVGIATAAHCYGCTAGAGSA